jgi:hypothetical protein
MLEAGPAEAAARRRNHEGGRALATLRRHGRHVETQAKDAAGAALRAAAAILEQHGAVA